MPRHLRYVVLTAGVAVLLAQSALIRPALAQTPPAHSHHRGYYHRHYASEYEQSYVQATIEEVARSPFYGPFGGYYEAAASSQYAGPNERRYFGRYLGNGQGFWGQGFWGQGFWGQPW
jgi:hypothetical protein